MHVLYDLLIKEVQTDIAQMEEEGHDPKGLLVELEAVAAKKSIDALAAFQQELWQRPSPESFPYAEPNDWESISKTFPDTESHARFAGNPARLADRLLAAWQGRCVGCQLGKPLEYVVMWPDKLKALVQFTDSWPITDYVNPMPEGANLEGLPHSELFKEWVANSWYQSCCRGRFHGSAPDDDINYAVTSQLTLEQYGNEFTTEQAIMKIIDLTPMIGLAAAGRNMFRTHFFGVPVPLTAVWGNPCRQSLGAMIRCDPFGWAAPGNPALAARLAYKDAVGSQVRNGIYAGVFFSVLLADTLAHGDPVRAIDTAEQYVPPRSRFAEMIRFVKAECAREACWEKVNQAMYERYASEAKTFNHSLTNAAIVLIGLLKGERDFTKTLGIAVMCGMDTDCTGATAGSIMGCALGTKGIPEHWTKPIDNIARTTLANMSDWKITDLAKGMFKIAEENCRYDRITNEGILQ